MKIENLDKTFGSNSVMKGFSLDVKPHGITCLIGPSGCGKTTLLNIIAGTLNPDAGTIIRDSDENGRTSYLFQEPRLLPWLTALENVAVVLEGDASAARNMLNEVGLEDSLEKYPNELSGGMKQRVSMARAFLYPSRLLLMDEPFQNLDTKLKSDLLKVFVKLWKQDERTVIWVTHDITEACLVADTIVCLSGNPMKIEGSFHMDIPRNERTLENTATIQAKIYRTLIG